jgi:hypothetical protein
MLLVRNLLWTAEVHHVSSSVHSRAHGFRRIQTKLTTPLPKCHLPLHPSNSYPKTLQLRSETAHKYVVLSATSQVSVRYDLDFRSEAAYSIHSNRIVHITLSHPNSYFANITRFMNAINWKGLSKRITMCIKVVIVHWLTGTSLMQTSAVRIKTK